MEYKNRGVERSTASEFPEDHGKWLGQSGKTSEGRGDYRFAIQIMCSLRELTLGSTCLRDSAKRQETPFCLENSGTRLMQP